ncbi:TonB-dependent receptor [Sphingorhabdus sp. EL138]|uniref:TonB-dependent receptor n=1 Tax=Sphingorhabdus sp. EL138 TaxID=2073156 RepID=UPI000D691E6C|nr:TonB-dependent receptor [Sphingorhabdus sp. EL138]
MRRISVSAISRFALAGALLAGGLSQPVLAQDEAGVDDDQLGTIVVTAQRREENIQDVPLSVSTLSNDALNAVQSGGNDIRSLAGRVPNLNIESSFGRTFPRFFIRGLGNTDFDLNASQPVSLVYDDVVLENPILKGFPVFDLDRIEVLRGPQGTLFGRNTPAGIVKFDTVKPGETGGYAKVSIARLGTYQVEGAAGVADDNGFSVRLSALYQHRDDWIDNVDNGPGNDLGGYDDVAARLQLQYEDGPLTARLVGQVRTMDGSAIVFRANSVATGSNDLIGLGGPGTEFERDLTRSDGINFQKLNNYNLGLTVEYDFGPVTLTSVTSYWEGDLQSRGDIDGGFSNDLPFTPPGGPGSIPFSAQTQDDVPSLNQYTQEIRVASNNDEGLGYQFGGFYFNERLDITTLDFGAPQDVTPAAIARQRQVSEAFGIFGSVFYAFDNGLKLQGGLRYNDDQRDFVAGRTLDTRPGFLGFGGPVPFQRTSVDANLLTWDLSALYEVSPDINIFARAARGYRAPAIQGRLAFGRTLSTATDERTMSYEAGIKTTFLDGRARFNLTGYYYNTEDLQLTAVGGGSNFTTLLNADDVEGYGFEAELEARPVENLTFTVGVGYNENEIKDDDLAVAGCGAPCTVLDPAVAGSPGIFSIDGNTLPQSPRWTVNWTAGYNIPLGSGELYAFTDWYYRSKINFFLYESVEFSDDSLLEGGLRVGYRTGNGKIDIAGFVRNITGDESAVGGIDFNNLTTFVNQPRIYGLEIGTKF